MDIAAPVKLARLLPLVLLALLLPGIASAAASPTAPLPTFLAKQQAQQRGLADTVVWLNLPTSIYHFQGQRWYGRTNSGAYVCQTEASGAGMRATRNGQ